VIPIFNLTTIKKALKSKVKRPKFWSVSIPLDVEWSSIYVPVITGSFIGVTPQFASATVFMKFLSKHVKDKGRSKTFAYSNQFDGIVFRTLDGTDARTKLKEVLLQIQPLGAEVNGNIRILSEYPSPWGESIEFLLSEAEQYEEPK